MMDSVSLDLGLDSMFVLSRFEKIRRGVRPPFEDYVFLIYPIT